MTFILALSLLFACFGLVRAHAQTPEESAALIVLGWKCNSRPMVQAADAVGLTHRCPSPNSYQAHCTNREAVTNTHLRTLCERTASVRQLSPCIYEVTENSPSFDTPTDARAKYTLTTTYKIDFTKMPRYDDYSEAELQRDIDELAKKYDLSKEEANASFQRSLDFPVRFSIYGEGIVCLAQSGARFVRNECVNEHYLSGITARQAMGLSQAIAFIKSNVCK
jgi:hypothetical protein